METKLQLNVNLGGTQKQSPFVGAMHEVYNLQLCGTFMCIQIRVDISKGCFADPVGAATSFQRDPWIHLCNGYVDYRIFLKKKVDDVSLKIIEELL